MLGAFLCDKLVGDKKLFQTTQATSDILRRNKIEITSRHD